MKTRSSGMSSIGRQRPQIHVTQRLLDASGDRRRIARRPGRDAAGDRRDHARVGAPGHVRHQLRPVDRHRPLVQGPRIGAQLPPAVQRRFPRRALRRVRRDPRRRQTSCRPGRPGPRARRPRCSCCTPSCGLPSTAPRIALPVYSMTCPIPPPMPMRPMMPSTMSLPVTPIGSSPSTRTSMGLGLRCGSVCVARTCSTSLVPIPNASAPSAPCVLVWLSPHTIGHAGLGQPELGTDHVDDALQWTEPVLESDAELRAVARQRIELLLGNRIGHRLAQRPGRRVVVHRGDGQVRAAAPSVPSDAGHRTPAASSPRGRGAGRCTAAWARRALRVRRERPRFFRTACEGALEHPKSTMGR